MHWLKNWLICALLSPNCCIVMKTSLITALKLKKSLSSFCLNCSIKITRAVVSSHISLTLKRKFLFLTYITLKKSVLSFLKMSGKISVMQCRYYQSFFFCSTATKQLTDKYEEQLQHFMNGVTVSQFKQLFPASATSSKLSAEKVAIKLKLKNYWDKSTLDDLTKLVSLFGVSGEHVHLSKVEKGCIAVTWLCSSDVKQLKIALSEAADALRLMGVLQVFIGEKLLECTQPHSTTAGN